MLFESTMTTETASDVLHNLGLELTNQTKRQVSQRTATCCNVVEFSNLVEKLLFILKHHPSANRKGR